MDDLCYTLNIAIHRLGEEYQIDVSHIDPTSQAQVAPLRASARFDRTELLAQVTNEDYGRELAKQLFADSDVKQRFLQVETAAQASSSSLRISLHIDRSAQELQSLRWELLRHPTTDATLTSSETLLFSRFMASSDWRPVKLRARAELSVLIAVSAPPAAKLRNMGLTPVDFESEVAGVKAALTGVTVRTLGGPGSPVTLERLLEALTGIDVLYLVSHGKFGEQNGTPTLVLQDDTGAVAIVRGEDLTVRIAERPTSLRLVVLASCQSGGTGEQVQAALRSSVQATLASRLADAGVPAVLAMQGFITMATINRMMPTFFTELLVDGQIDRALAVARSKVRDRADSWMPALYMRLTTGRLWYTPGFVSSKGKAAWQKLLKPVCDGEVVPILGPRLLESAHGSAHETALNLAGANHFPFGAHEWDDLPRVTEYISVTESRKNVIRHYKDQLLKDLIARHRHWLPADALPSATHKPPLGKLLALVGDHLREKNSVDPFQILAELPASVYITTNFDPLLERALKACQREPQQILTRWRYQTSPQSAGEIAKPSRNKPLVYHAFGAFGADDDDSGLVLTEDDYFDYMIGTAADKLMPPVVESALVRNSLLFLGFRLTDWHFRVLFRLIMSLPGRVRLKEYCHVAVQVDPDLQTMKDVEGVKVYLGKYFGQEANIDIYWGSAEEFLMALREELGAAGDLAAQPKQDDDEWIF